MENADLTRSSRILLIIWKLSQTTSRSGKFSTHPDPTRHCVKIVTRPAGRPDLWTTLCWTLYVALLLTVFKSSYTIIIISNMHRNHCRNVLRAGDIHSKILIIVYSRLLNDVNSMCWLTKPRVGFGAQVCYHCRISPPRFLAECCKRRLNQGSFVLLFFRLYTLSDLYLVFACLLSLRRR